MQPLNKPISITASISFTPVDNQRLLSLCGQCNEHLQQLEIHFSVEIHQRGHHFQLIGQSQAAVNASSEALSRLYQATADDTSITPNEVHLVIKESLDTERQTRAVSTLNCTVRSRGKHQSEYLRCILQNAITFGIGPAGTGKTFLAVACAAEALERELVERLVLVRPAVEAGERLGFLPGDLNQKVDPYLRPLYDALYEMFDAEKVNKLVQSNRIEVAPLAYMRGRTLNDSFIILDEAQNTTTAQMKMFLTRIGFGSTAVITGDVTQVDLPSHTPSGLIHAMQVLRSIDTINFCHFAASDVVRHPLVQRIVEAYGKHDEQLATNKQRAHSSKQHKPTPDNDQTDQTGKLT